MGYKYWNRGRNLFHLPFNSSYSMWYQSLRLLNLEIYIYILSETKNIVLIVVKIQEKDERSFPQNTKSDQSKNTPLYRKLYTKIIPNYLKLLNHKPQSNWVVKH